VKAVLAVFLKAPRPGAVKTRLVPALGAAGAARLYRALAEAVVAGTRPGPGEYERLFFFTPAEARPEMEAWFADEAWIAQEGADLGARMSSAFDEAFRRGADRVAIVGTDVHGLTRHDAGIALAALQDHDLVLGPARDGGYYLIGLGHRRPALFEGVAWGTGSVFAATMERAAALGLSVRVLEERRDIDTLEDVRAEWARLRPLLDEDLAEDLARKLGP
jgi:rSAM/selenodomain-associated transferase 1